MNRIPKRILEKVKIDSNETMQLKKRLEHAIKDLRSEKSVGDLRTLVRDGKQSNDDKTQALASELDRILLKLLSIPSVNRLLGLMEALGKAHERVLSDFNAFFDGLPPKEMKELEKMTVPEFHIFRDGYLYCRNKYEPIIHGLLEEIKSHPNWSFKRAAKPEKKFRKQIEAKQLRAAISKTPELKNGKPNWSAIGRMLGCDPETARDQATQLGLVR